MACLEFVSVFVSIQNVQSSYDIQLHPLYGSTFLALILYQVVMQRNSMKPLVFPFQCLIVLNTETCSELPALGDESNESKQAHKSHHYYLLLVIAVGWPKKLSVFLSFTLFALVTVTNPCVLLIPRALMKPQAKTSEYCCFSQSSPLQTVAQISVLSLQPER